MAKTATIRIRIKPEDKERFEKAAREAEVTLSAWMIFAGKEKLRLSEALEGGESDADDGLSSTANVVPGAAHPVNTREAQPAKASSGHDPKTCRVYRCLQCVAAGKKF